MNRFGMAGCVAIVMLLAASSMFALHAALGPHAGTRPRMLFIDSGPGEYQQRALAGARAAARELGIDLQVETLTSDNLKDQQLAIVQRIGPADYAGVALSPADPESQLDLINQLADRTKLVTIGRDCCKSRRLCHVGFCPTNDGSLVARLVRDGMSPHRKVVLFASKFPDAASNFRVNERLAGFKDLWAAYDEYPSMSCPLIEIAIESSNLEKASQELSAALTDPELAFIVTFDTKAAESALNALATRSGTRRIPVIAFDPSAAVFDAIADGRVSFAIFDDPYRNGFAAIKRLGILSHADTDALPMPGYGTDVLISEVVGKENLVDVRERTRS